MRRAVLGVAAAAVVASAVSVGAQERRQGGGQYHLANEKTISAKVIGVETDEPVPGQVVPFLAVTVDGKPLRIFLAPADWMEKQKFEFTPGATAEITGVPGYRLNGDAMMPRRIKIGAKTLTLRDSEGKPLW